MENFRRFLQFFLQFFGKFLQFFRNFLRFFWKIFPKILQFFPTFATSLRFSPENFSENSRSQSVTVQPGFRHYCKFTSKFTSRITPKFTPILIKILQSTKFEGSHFRNLSQPLMASYQLPKPFTTTENFAPRHRVFPIVAPPCQRHQWPSLPLRRRRYVGNTRDYK